MTSLCILFKEKIFYKQKLHAEWLLQDDMFCLETLFFLDLRGLKNEIGFFGYLRIRLFLMVKADEMFKMTLVRFSLGLG